MLPGLRFLFAATLISTSLLVFGMGAIALLRASHQQFASLPPHPPSEPVFAQAPETVPSLSMLRAEPEVPAAAPPAQGAAPEPDRAASLTNAERAANPAPPLVLQPAAPVIAEPATTPGPPPPDTRSETVPEPTRPMPEVAPLAQLPIAEEPAIAVAEAPAAIALPPAAEIVANVATVEAQPIEITGSITPPPAEQPAAASVADPPLPQARPAVASIAPPAAAKAKAAPKAVVKLSVRHAAKHRRRAKVEKLTPATSAPTFGSLFGGSTTNQ